MLRTLKDYYNFSNEICGGHTREDCQGNLRLISHELVYNLLGLGGESGEVLDKAKKAIRKDARANLSEHLSEHSSLDTFAAEYEESPEQRRKLLLELGDTLYYISRAANMVGSDLEEVANLNREKLLDRQARGVVKGEGDDR